MSRLTKKTYDELSDEQKKLFDSIVETRSITPRGQIGGPFDAWLTNAEMGSRIVGLGGMFRFKTSVDRRYIELTILVTGQFWQTRPDLDEPASERTEIRIGYTADTLYLGIVLYDQTPADIIVSDSRRDASLNDTDSIQFIIDGFRDGQNGYVFGTNPAGIEYDGQLVNEASGVSL